MRIPIVRLIASKEMWDLLRDRRTVLLVLLLPVLLYPLFGSAGFLFARSMLGQTSVIGVAGGEHLPRSGWPMLLRPDGAAFADGLIEKDPAETGGTFTLRPITSEDPQELLKGKAVDVVIVVPADFTRKLEAGVEKPRITLLSREGDEKAKLALRRTSDLIGSWEKAVKKERFRRDNRGEDYDRQFLVDDPQKSKPPEKKAADELRDTFVRMFPFILIVWVVAGAIQPAVDLTAGEKERGTMETLLISPASRGEIVCGKFIAVTAFGFASVVWNVFWLSLSGLLLGAVLEFQVISIPGVFGCLLLGLPIAMLFSGVSLALGVFARSTKEGQYYLMPLMLFTMPLAFWSVLPGVELSTGMSLVPVTGVMLLQQKLLAAGEPIPWSYLPQVLGSLAISVAGALALAVWQFRRESVLFRESGPTRTRGGLFGWLRK